MKVNEIIERVRSLISEKYHIADHIYSRRHIYNKLVSARSRLLYQEANKKKNLTQWNYQTLPCIELILVPQHNCPCYKPVGCGILRSKHKIPKPLIGLYGALVHSVYTIDGSRKLNEVSINAVNSLKGNKYSQNTLAYFIQNDYLYIVSNTLLKVITLTGLFEDPLEAANFPNACGEDCVDCNNCRDYLNEDFPIDNNLIDVLIELTLQELIIKRQTNGTQE